MLLSALPPNPSLQRAYITYKPVVSRGLLGRLNSLIKTERETQLFIPHVAWNAIYHFTDLMNESVRPKDIQNLA